MGMGMGKGEVGIKARVGKEDANGEGSKGVDVDVLGGDTVAGEGGIGGGDRLLRPGRYAKGISLPLSLPLIFLDSGLQPVLEEELEEDAV